MPEKVNLAEAFGSFQEAWNPRIVGAVNGVQVRLAKFRGEFIWHRHDEEDELFLVNRGNLRMSFRDGDVRLGPGEFIIVPRGTEHMPVAESEECEILNLAPGTLVNTGNVTNERTRTQLSTIQQSRPGVR